MKQGFEAKHMSVRNAIDGDNPVIVLIFGLKEDCPGKKIWVVISVVVQHDGWIGVCWESFVDKLRELFRVLTAHLDIECVRRFIYLIIESCS